MNMKYIRFENTYRDILDCYEAMKEGVEGLSVSEKKHHDLLLQLCQKIGTEFCGEKYEK